MSQQNGKETPDPMKEAEKHLANVKLTRRNQPQPVVAVQQPKPFPDRAKTVTIAGNICAVSGGHDIVPMLVKQHMPTHEDPHRVVDVTINFCKRCGGNLAEIRG